VTAELIEHYEALLAGEPMLAQAMCVTVVEGCTPEQALSRMGADRETLRQRTVAEADELRWPALAAPFAGGAIVLEPNGFQATRPEVIRALTAGGGRSTTVFWNINAVQEVLRAEGGRRRWSFSPPVDEPHRDGPLEEIRAAIAGLPFDEEEWLDFPALALTLLERETGFRLDAGWLAAPHLSASLVELAQDIVSPDNVDDPALAEPEVAAILADPSSVDRRRVDVIAAERAVRVTAVADAVVTEALRLLRAEQRVPAELVEELKRLASDLNRRSRAQEANLAPGEQVWSSRAGELSRQADAVRAVLGAAGVMPHFACISADLAVLAVWTSYRGDALVISAMKRVRHHARTPQ
jgi:hypothetical protein